MLHIEEQAVRNLLFQGRFGLEEESLRVTSEGYMAQTEHPFPDDPYIVKDFSENQTEINTPVADSAQEAVHLLSSNYERIQQKLRGMPERELLWPFSNPPYIRRDSDIPIAIFRGGDGEGTKYREYLAERYGKYKMTFSGIHVNYSFSRELLQVSYELAGKKGQLPAAVHSFQDYVNQFYLELAEKAAAFGWLLVALTAASPIMDSSYFERGRFGVDQFVGMASVRCSELGYWNSFTPYFCYDSLEAYTDSIRQFVNSGLLAAARELYYPIRLKPPGKYSLEGLQEKGVDHIELRMFDLNPFVYGGVDCRDVEFAQLFLIWLAAKERIPLNMREQVEAAQNFKNAAHYDLKTVKITWMDGRLRSVASAGLALLEEMQAFYAEADVHIREILAFQKSKFENADNRYAWRFRREYGEHFVAQGLKFAECLQQKACEKAGAADPAGAEAAGGQAGRQR